MQQTHDLTTISQSLHDAAAGPRFTPINLTPLNTETQSEADLPDAHTPITTPSETNPSNNPDSNEIQASQETAFLSVDTATPQVQPSGTTIAGVAVAAGGGLLLWALWQWGRRGATSRREAAMHSRIQSSATSQSAPAAQLSTPSPAHQQLIAAADRIARQLEQRAGQLERYIEQADHRIIELKRLSMASVPQRPTQTASTGSTLTHTQVPTSSTPQRTQFPRSTNENPKAASAVASLAPSTSTSTRTLSLSSSPSTSTHATNHTASTLATQHAEVHALADAGLTPVEIAQRLSKPTGQIELILNLRKVAMAG